jgi:hypothetical protein
MKKLLLIVFLGLGTIAYAQVEKGDFNATASFSLQNDKYDGGESENSMTFIGRGGYYLTNNVELGVSLIVFGMQDITMMGYGPYAVYNFLTSGGKLLPYVGANYFRFDAGIEGFDPIAQIGGVGGVKYFITEVVNIDTSLNYTSFLGDQKGSSLYLNVGIGINFGKLK